MTKQQSVEPGNGLTYEEITERTRAYLLEIKAYHGGATDDLSRELYKGWATGAVFLWGRLAKPGARSPFLIDEAEFNEIVLSFDEGDPA